jgi:hypothetical protein
MMALLRYPRSGFGTGLAMLILGVDAEATLMAQKNGPGAGLTR